MKRTHFQLNHVATVSTLVQIYGSVTTNVLENGVVVSSSVTRSKVGNRGKPSSLDTTLNFAERNKTVVNHGRVPEIAKITTPV